MKNYTFLFLKLIKNRYKSKKWSTIDYFNWFINILYVKAFLLEGKDYKNMIKTFSILLMDKLNIKHRTDLPTTEELKVAINQLKTIPKIMPFCILILVPLPFMVESYLFISFLVWKLSNGEINMLPNKFKIILEDLENRKIFKFLNKKK